MREDVYIRKCEKCGKAVYGIFTSAFEDSFTILFECSQCGRAWSEDKPLDTGAAEAKGEIDAGAKNGAADK